MTRNHLLGSTLVALALALAGCAAPDGSESVDDPDAMGDPEDNGLDVGGNDTAENATPVPGGDTPADTADDAPTDDAPAGGGSGLYG